MFTTLDVTRRDGVTLYLPRKNDRTQLTKGSVQARDGSRPRDEGPLARRKVKIYC